MARFKEALGSGLFEKLSTLVQIQQQSREASDLNYDPGDLLEMAKDYDQKFAGINKNPRLSTLGVDDAKNELVRETFGKFTAWSEKAMGNLTDQIDSLRAALRNETGTGPTDPTEKLLLEIRQQEIRRAFVGLDAIEAELVFTAGTPEVRAALLGGPGVLRRGSSKLPKVEPFIDPEVADRVLLGELESGNPAKVEEIKTFEILRNKFQALIIMFRGALVAQSPTIGGEPVGEIQDLKRIG